MLVYLSDTPSGSAILMVSSSSGASVLRSPTTSTPQ